MAKISIIIISFNQRDYLKEAIESVLNQTYKPYEIIICDDASTDGSQDLIADYKRRYPGLIKEILHEQNIGIGRNRNSGLERGGGQFVSWLDGDDIYKPRKLEMELQTLLRTADAKWAYSQVDLVDAKREKLGVRYPGSMEGYIFELVVMMLGYAPRNQLVEYEALRKIGFFRTDMSMYEDFDLCLRLARNYKAVYCPEPLVEYRMHSGGVHNATANNHLTNFNKLRENFRELISDYPEDKRADLEEKLSSVISNITKNFSSNNIVAEKKKGNYNVLVRLIHNINRLHGK